MTIQEIQEVSEKILNHWALTDTKQLGLQVCTETIRLTSENERLRAERDALLITHVPRICITCFHSNGIDGSECLKGSYKSDQAHCLNWQWRRTED